MERLGRSEEWMGESDGRLPIGECFELLSVERRRRVLAVLRTERDPMSIDGLVERIGDREPTADGDELSISLRHHHLPALADANVVEYDGETVFRGANFDDVVHRWRAVVDRSEDLDATVT